MTVFFRECLLVDPKERPMVLAEQCSNTQEQRERAAELMFEKYIVPALFLAKNAVLTSFASGRATSLVVDRLELSGAGSTTVAPVLDGYVLQKAVISSPIGGQFLTECLTFPGNLQRRRIKDKSVDLERVILKVGFRRVESKGRGGKRSETSMNLRREIDTLAEERGMTRGRRSGR
ncbi:hypothetical protein V8G54_031120 [Vigna mungo]|uniref:Uncharacterized protein n=1 Tax=Vigna mungo TaxID=3915 RepID=A0AAQ3MY85_VIGMU